MDGKMSFAGIVQSLPNPTPLR
jgi:hypothetical protein